MRVRACSYKYPAAARGAQSIEVRARACPVAAVGCVSVRSHVVGGIR